VSVSKDLPMVRGPWDCVKREVLEESKAVYGSSVEAYYVYGSVRAKNEES